MENLNKSSTAFNITNCKLFSSIDMMSFCPDYEYLMMKGTPALKLEDKINYSRTSNFSSNLYSA